jgi:hypothetical protein
VVSKAGHAFQNGVGQRLPVRWVSTPGWLRISRRATAMAGNGQDDVQDEQEEEPERHVW